MSSPKVSFAFLTATEAAKAVRTKEISASDLVQQTFDRIDRYNSRLNAIVWEDRDQSMARARLADEALAAGKALGALHGVPVTIKEAFAYRGSPNTWGLPDLAHATSPRTARAVERLEAAGAIVVGKTNVPVMLADWQTNNPIFGTSNNPWDLKRTPGGSTGGGSAALAAGLGHLTLGSDLAGSIRIPAHFCGVYGHKPSLGLVSMDGFQPGPWDGSPGYPMDLAGVGPLARSARDLAVAMEVLGGPEPEDAKAWSWRMPPPRHNRLEDFRIGYVVDDAFAPVASDVRAVYETVLTQLGTSGAVMQQGWPAGVDLAAHVKTFQYLLFSLVTVDADRDEIERARKRLRENPEDIAAAATVEPHQRWLQETQRRLVFRALWQKYFANYDVFILPTTFTAAFPHDHSSPLEGRVVDTPEGKRSYVRDISYWISFATVTGLPATVAPVGRTAGGLPVGVQIVAPMWEDSTSIEFAARLGEVIGGFTPPPLAGE